MTPGYLEFTIKLPGSDSPFGQWMEKNGAAITFCCMLGQFDVTVTWCRVHRYDDERGEHRETWSISRHHADFSTALRNAIEAAQGEQARA